MKLKTLKKTVLTLTLSAIMLLGTAGSAAASQTGMADSNSIQSGTAQESNSEDAFFDGSMDEETENDISPADNSDNMETGNAVNSEGERKNEEEDKSESQTVILYTGTEEENGLADETDLKTEKDEVRLSSVKTLMITMTGFQSYELAGFGSGYDAAFAVAAGQYEGNGNAFCLNPSVQAPGRDSMNQEVEYSADVEEYSDQMLLKILYYGFGGAGDITEAYADNAPARHILTHMIAVRRAAELGIPGAGDYTYGANAYAISLADRLYSAIAEQPDLTGTASVLTPVSGLQTIILLSQAEVYTKPVRGDFDFTKRSEKTGKPLSSVPFMIISEETGESHILVTDENGFASTESAVTPHSQKTNEGTDSTCGIWFGDADSLDDTLGAMLPGIYTVQELPCDANSGMDLLSFEVTISEDEPVKHIGDINNLTIGIGTTALSGTTGTHTAAVSEKETVTDTVAYENLTEGREYKLCGTIVNRETGDKLASGTTVFTAEKSNGTAEVAFTLNTMELEGETLVVYEELYDGTSKRAEHREKMDEKQTIYVPEIHTTAADGKTGDHVGTVSDTVTLVDTVEYTGLEIGKTYTVTGTLMNQSTGEPVAAAAPDKTGGTSGSSAQTVTAKTVFTAETSDGSIDVTFTFDASSLAGETVTAFETLEYNEIPLCTHADLEDESQSVHYPAIATSASVDGNKEITAGETVTIMDKVTYHNLIPGQTYSVSGVLMDQSTGKEIQADGKSVTSETSFTPEDSEGSIEIPFTFNTAALGGKTTVVFESLIHNGVETAAHADLKDEGQTVVIKEKPASTKTVTPTPSSSGTTASPATGDRSMVHVFMILLLAAGSVLAGTLVLRKKKKI